MGYFSDTADREVRYVCQTQAGHTTSVRNRVLMTRVLLERVSADDSGSCWELG